MLDPLESWGLRTKRRRPDLSIPGSPERCVSRSVLEDAAGKLWLLERLTTHQTARRNTIARCLDALHDSGMFQVPAYAKTSDGSFYAEIAGMRWQLSPFILSDPLPQPTYLNDAIRGESLAQCISAFTYHRATLPNEMLHALGPRLDMERYALDLATTVKNCEPEIYSRLEPLLFRLQPLLHQCAALPSALQHGDLHPLNVLWQGQEVLAVIDWEFLGVKPECYDLANLLGCLGFEHPSGLHGPLAMTLITGLRRAGTLQESSWKLLPGFLAVQRLAWLSEWLRNSERDLVDMELDYMNMLLDNATELRRAWSTA